MAQAERLVVLSTCLFVKAGRVVDRSHTDVVNICIPPATARTSFLWVTPVLGCPFDLYVRKMGWRLGSSANWEFPFASGNRGNIRRSHDAGWRHGKSFLVATIAHDCLIAPQFTQDSSNLCRLLSELVVNCPCCKNATSILMKCSALLQCS